MPSFARRLVPMRVPRRWSASWIAFRCEFASVAAIRLFPSHCSEKEREHAGLESEAAAADKSLQHAEMTLSSSKAQLKAKRDELKCMFIT
jgi:hypothetical protein